MTAFLALFPVFAMIAVGWLARVTKLATPEGLVALNRLGYWIFYPAFLFSAVVKANFHGPQAASFVAAIMVGFVVLGALALALKPLIRADGPAFTSVFQAGMRWNSFVLLAAASSLFGPQGAGLIALAFGPAIALVNLMCVAVLSRWGDGQNSGKPIFLQILRSLATNPLILSCLAGLVVNFAGLKVPSLLDAPLDLLSKAAMTMALIGVGAGLTLNGILKAPGLVAISSILKLIIAPIVMGVSAIAFGVTGPAFLVAIAIGSTPTAAAAYVLAREMGGDAPLMASIVSFTTLLSMATMPVVLALASHWFG